MKIAIITQRNGTDCATVSVSDGESIVKAAADAIASRVAQGLAPTGAVYDVLSDGEVIATLEQSPNRGHRWGVQVVRA